MRATRRTFRRSFEGRLPADATPLFSFCYNTPVDTDKKINPRPRPSIYLFVINPSIYFRLRALRKPTFRIPRRAFLSFRVSPHR